MDSIEQEKSQAMTEFRRAESSRRALRALLIFLLLSFFLLVSLSPWDELHLSLFLVDLPDSFWVDRKAIFLVCNIILVVVAMNSGLLSSFVPEMEPCDELPPAREKGHRSTEERPSGVGLVASAGSTLQVLAMDKGREQEEEGGGEEQEEEQEEEEGEEEEEEAEVEEDGCPDMDELKKKFEDFIEKVKRGMEMEALQLVLV